MTTGDGGMITTANPEWDRKFRLLRQHGMSVPDTVRHGANQVIFEAYPVVGYNYRMTDIQAAVGREQLKRLPEIIAGAPRDRGALPQAARRDPRPGAAARARLGAQQLAELLRAPARRTATSAR